MLNKIVFLLLTLMSGTSLYGQADTIRLNKSSFEQKAQSGGKLTPIRGWFDCGIIHFPEESAPDIHPVDFWGNTKQAQDGKTYLGMVVRDNDTYESVSQKLSSKLIASQCYSFTLYLSKSERYLSASSLNREGKKVNYTRPVVLRIWGGFGYCDSRELLAETVPVDHSEWKEYTFKFRPKVNMSSITLEAFYKVPVVFPYNGHILVDNLSEIVKIDCSAPEEVAEADGKSAPPPHKIRKHKPKSKPKKKTGTKVENTGEIAHTKILKDLDRSKIREGQTIEIENLYFKADTTTINKGSFDVLDEVYRFLATNRDVKIEIGGHTNGTPKHKYCDILSSRRAKAVAQYLVRKGISASRLKYKGYGKRKPVASNFTKEGRKKNQRVEIKILSIG